MLELFEKDKETELVILIGEIRGVAEQEAALSRHIQNLQCGLEEKGYRRSDTLVLRIS